MTPLRAPDPLAAAALGLAVFPIPPGAKAPAPPGWQRAATADPGRILDVWPAEANIGVACWRSQLVVLDLDVPGPGHRTTTSGIDSLAAAAAAHDEPWPHTLTVRTPSGGMHLYYRVPDGAVIGSTSGGKTALGEGIDTRGPGAGGRGGYVVGPDSAVDGRRYRIEHDVPIAPLPGWIAAVLAVPDPLPLALIARMIGVGRAAVANCRRRHDDFPEPVGGTDESPLFALTDAIGWLTAHGYLPHPPDARPAADTARTTGSTA